MDFRVPMAKLREIRADKEWMDTLHPMERGIVQFYVDNFCQVDSTEGIFVVGLYMAFENVFHELKHGSPAHRQHMASPSITRPVKQEEMCMRLFMEGAFIRKLDTVLPDLKKHWDAFQDDARRSMDAATG